MAILRIAICFSSSVTYFLRIISKAKSTPCPFPSDSEDREVSELAMFFFWLGAADQKDYVKAAPKARVRHTQFNRKSTIFGLQIGSFQGRSFPTTGQRERRPWVRGCLQYLTRLRGSRITAALHLFAEWRFSIRLVWLCSFSESSLKFYSNFVSGVVFLSCFAFWRK